MPKYQNFVIKLFTKLTMMLIILIFSLSAISPALALTQELQFNTAAGYIVKTTFSYNEAQKAEIISEHGQGKTAFIDSMKVSFYQPSGELIANYDNIVDGIVKGTYFEFNFNPATQQLSGSLDIGGESAGEIYLRGKANQELSLIEVTQSGKEKVLDQVKQPTLN